MSGTKILFKYCTGLENDLICIPNKALENWQPCLCPVFQSTSWNLQCDSERRKQKDLNKHSVIIAESLPSYSRFLLTISRDWFSGRVSLPVSPKKGNSGNQTVGGLWLIPVYLKDFIPLVNHTDETESQLAASEDPVSLSEKLLIL